MLFIGVWAYYNYSRPGVLFLVMIPEYLSVIHLILGVYFILFGIQIYQSNLRALNKAVFLFGFIPSIVIGKICVDLILYGSPLLWIDSVFYMIINVFIAITISVLRSEGFVFYGVSIVKLIPKQKVSTFWTIVILIILAIIVSNTFTYDCFMLLKIRLFG